MSKKDYEAIAAEIRAVVTSTSDPAVWTAFSDLAIRLTSVFERENRKFDSCRFLEATGLVNKDN